MAEPYIAEVQTARWTSDGIREAFRAAGFEVRDWPLTQHLEKDVPADSVFFSPTFSKLFGLQYKTIYQNRKDFWPLDRAQHETLQRYPWIFYCCSELRDVADHGLALHFARFYRSRFEFRPELSASVLFHGGRPYFRWGSFYRSLKECRIGAKVRSRDELRELLSPIVGAPRFREVNQMGEFLLADFENRVVLAERLF
jgi:hypothetical protein